MDFKTTNRLIENLKAAIQQMTDSLYALRAIAKKHQSETNVITHTSWCFEEDLRSALLEAKHNLTARESFKLRNKQITDPEAIENKDFKMLLGKSQFNDIEKEVISMAIRFQQPTFEDWKQEYYNNLKEFNKEDLNEIYRNEFKGVIGEFPLSEFDFPCDRLNFFFQLRDIGAITLHEREIEMQYLDIAMAFNSYSERIDKVIGLKKSITKEAAEQTLVPTVDQEVKPVFQIPIKDIPAIHRWLSNGTIESESERTTQDFFSFSPDAKKTTVRILRKEYLIKAIKGLFNYYQKITPIDITQLTAFQSFRDMYNIKPTTWNKNVPLGENAIKKNLKDR